MHEMWPKAEQTRMVDSPDIEGRLTPGHDEEGGSFDNVGSEPGTDKRFRHQSVGRVERDQVAPGAEQNATPVDARAKRLLGRLEGAVYCQRPALARLDHIGRQLPRESTAHLDPSPDSRATE